MKKETNTRLRSLLISGAFFSSGVIALVYEVVAMRHLRLLLGASAYAASAVLAAFMGGLALGSLIGGRRADRGGRLLLGYGIVEIVAALCFLLVGPVVRLLFPLYGWCYGASGEATGVLLLTQFVVAVSALLVPCVLLGMTLPMMVRAAGYAAMVRGAGLLGSTG